MKDLWEQSAEQYDHYASNYPQYKETNQKLVELSDLQAGDIVIDLACGTGATTQKILETQPEVSQVFAIDNSEAMLEKAKGNVVSPKVTFIHAEAEEVGTVVDKADRVLCNSAFWQFSKPKETLQAINRLLSNDGLCVFNFPQQFFDMGEDSHRNAFMRRVFEELNSEGFLPKRELKDKYTEAQMKQLIEDSGFQLVRIVYEEFEGKNAEDTEAFLKIPATAPFFNSVPEEVQERILRKVKNELEEEGTQAPVSKWAYFVLSKK